jgi:hypothetical protein
MMSSASSLIAVLLLGRRRPVMRRELAGQMGAGPLSGAARPSGPPANAACTRGRRWLGPTGRLRWPGCGRRRTRHDPHRWEACVAGPSRSRCGCYRPSTGSGTVWSSSRSSTACRRRSSAGTPRGC